MDFHRPSKFEVKHHMLDLLLSFKHEHIPSMFNIGNKPHILYSRSTREYSIPLCHRQQRSLLGPILIKSSRYQEISKACHLLVVRQSHFIA